MLKSTLTSTGIAKNIETGLIHSSSKSSRVLCSSKEFRLNLDIAKLKGSELNDSIIPEFVCLLRQLNIEWHHTAGGLGGLLRFPGEPEEGSPHIFCPESVGSIQFDLHGEYKKVYTDLNVSEVLMAFFLVAFIGNIHYPEAGESVPILLDSPEAIWVKKCLVHV